jgi:hypothetical protein
VDPNGAATFAGYNLNRALGRVNADGSIKPKGGYFTRPEFRVFGTYAICDHALRGSIGGTPYQNSNQGWMFGTQVEWFF